MATWTGLGPRPLGASACVLGSLVAAALVWVQPAQAAPMCFGERATIVASSGGIQGTPQDDVIYARRGVYAVEGHAGDDRLCADGDLEIYGNLGDDRVDTGTDFGLLVGGGGSDVLRGRTGTDYFYPGPGDDRVLGGRDTDEIIYSGGPGVQANLRLGVASGRGADRIDGIENLTGSFRDDVLVGDNRPNTLDAGNGSDEVRGLGGGDLLFGRARSDSPGRRLRGRRVVRRLPPPRLRRRRPRDRLLLRRRGRPGLRAAVGRRPDAGRSRI